MATSAQFERAKWHAATVRFIEIDDKTPAADQPDYVCPLIANQLQAVQRVRDVYAGTQRLRDRAEEYLPRHEAEDDDKLYQRRVQRAILFNATKRTGHGLIGMIFRKAPQLSDDMAEDIKEHCANIDNNGSSLAVFLKQRGLDSMLDGLAAIHVEFPKDPGFTDSEGNPRKPTQQEERALGRRPYWIGLTLDRITNVQWEMRDGKPFLTLFAYRDYDQVPVGRYGARMVEQIRILRPGSFELWEKQDYEDEKDKKTKVRWVLVDEGQTSLDYIPIVPVYGPDRKGEWEADPPLIDLVEENIGHFRNANEHEMSLARGRIPMPFFSGFDASKVKWGPNYSIYTEEKGADAKMLETEGNAFDASKADLDDRMARMAALGLSMLVRETRAAETAEAKLIDKSESDSRLAAFAKNLDDAANACLRIHGDYLGRTDVGSVAVNKDFKQWEINPQLLDALLKMREARGLRWETIWAILFEGEVLPEDFDPEVEKDLLEQEEQKHQEEQAAMLKLQSMRRLGGAPAGAAAEA